MARYDIVSLEDSLQQAYDQYVANPNDPDTRTRLFTALRDLTKAIVEVEGRKHKRRDPYAGIDKDRLAYEYAVCMFRRIVEGRFVLPDLQGRSKFAWTPYIKLSIRHILWTEFGREEEREVPFGDLGVILKSCYVEGRSASILSLLEEVTGWDGVRDEFFYTTESGEGGEAEVRFYKKEVVEALKNVLDLLYGEEKVKEYLRCLITLPQSEWKKVEGMDEFVSVFAVLYKRMFEDLRIKPCSVDVDMVLRSTLFLASILSSKKPDRKLFISLDLKNLYRLSMVCGGRRVYIPTVEELEDLIASVYVVWRMLKEKVGLKAAKREAKEKFKFQSRLLRVDKYVEALSRFLSLNLERKEMEEESEESKSVVNLLLSVVISLHKAIEQTLESVKRVVTEEKDVKKLVEIYGELSSMLDTVQRSVLSMREVLREVQK